MLRQIRLLTKIQLCNMYGWNEFLHTRDKKKRMRYMGLGVLWLLLIAMLVSYIAAFAYGFCWLGLGDIVPAYLYAITSIVILIFTFFKAGSVLFGQKGYELQVSLPVHPSAIVTSRFLTMYVTSLIPAVFVMATGSIVYGLLESPPVLFYLVAAAGTVFLPLLPITLATAAGAGITAIASRMRHKSLVTAALSIVFAMAVVIASTVFSGQAASLDVQALGNLAALAREQIGTLYPPAVWFANAALGGTAVAGGMAAFLLFTACSLFIFVLLVALLQKNFLAICTALNASYTKNNYKMQTLQQSSIVGALWKKEVRRYFASSIYVTNTIIGSVMMAGAAVAVFFTGASFIDGTLGIPGVTIRCFPVILGMLPAMMPTTSCAISMEGRQWWLMQTLPVKMRDILSAKILLNLSVVFPFYLIAEVFALLAIRPSLVEGIWLVVIPAAYTLFSAVMGLAINLRLPVFNWENEMRVVKQSASTFLTMLVDMLAAIVPMAVLMLLPQVSMHLIFGALTVVLLGISGILMVWASHSRML